MRDECQAVETELSYVRRLVQARLDIVGAERSRRDEGAAPAAVADLVESLPGVLSRSHPRPRHRSTASTHGARGVASAVWRPSSTTVVAGHDIQSLPGVGDADLDTLHAALSTFEQKVSGLRHDLFERIDALQAEITRRYRTGEATVESLLR